MVRRFQARHASGASHGGIGPNTLDNQSGVVDQQTLSWVARTWKLYVNAVEQWGSRPEINLETDTGFNDTEWAQWRSEAVAIWEDGIQDKSQGNSIVPASYTSTIHNEVLALADAESRAEELTRAALLDAWIHKEASFHWGSGDPATPYRIHEGSADEEGSLSFNQVLFRFWASDDPCPAHAKAGLNYMKPVENLKGFAVHTAAGGVCAGSFARGFASDQLSEKRPAVPGDNRQPGDLVGYRHGGSSVTQIGPCPEGEPDCDRYVAAQEDNYEVLAKAIALFNGGSRILLGNSWPHVLKTVALADNSGRNVTNPPGGGPDQCFSCEYTIDIRNDMNLPHRSYIWYGGEWTEQEDPEKAGEDWCFAYGESEWRGPFPVEDEGDRPAAFNDYLTRAQRDDAYRTDCE